MRQRMEKAKCDLWRDEKDGKKTIAVTFDKAANEDMTEVVYDMFKEVLESLDNLGVTYKVTEKKYIKGLSDL